MSLNKVFLIGNLGKDVDLRHTPSGQAVATFSLATNEKYMKDNTPVNKVEWHTVVAFGKQAEICNQYLHKGSQVHVEGKIQTRSWDDKDGNKKCKTEIIVTHITFLSGDPDRGANNDATSVQTPTPDTSNDGLPF